MRRWWQRELYTNREVYSGSRLLADLNFQSASGLYKDFTRKSPSEFEFLINLSGGKKSRKRTQRSGKPFLFKKGWHWRCVSINSMTLPSVHSVLQLQKRHSSRQKHQEWKEGQRSGQCWRVTLYVHTCWGRNRIIPLMRRPNTDSTPNKPVTLPLNQLLIRYAVTSPVHTVTIRGNVTSVYPPLDAPCVMFVCRTWWI